MRSFIRFFIVYLLLNLFISNVFAQENGTGKVEPGVIVEKGGSLIGRRNIVIEPGFQYSHNTSNRLDVAGVTLIPAFIIGNMQVAKIRRDILTPSLTFRFGISDVFQLNLKVPYMFRFDRNTFTASDGTTTTGPVSERSRDASLGDIEGSILFTLLKEKAEHPQIAAGVKVKSRTGKDPYGLKTKEVEGVPGVRVSDDLPTGSGHWAFEPYITTVKTLDPAVLFANFSYYYHEKRNIEGIGEVDPSDSINFSLGMAYALNEKLALSTTYEQRIFTRAKLEDEKQEETDPVVGTLTLGASYAFSETTAMNLSLGIGLTDDASDIQVSLNFPRRFSF